MGEKCYKYFVLLLTVIIVKQSVAQLPDLIPYRKGNLWGYCDSNKVVKIEPKYAYAFWFNEYAAEVGYYCVDEYGDSGVCIKYINKQGIELSQACRKLDSSFCLLTNKKENTLTLISEHKKTKVLKSELLYNGYSYNPTHKRFKQILVFKKDKQVFIYKAHEKPVSFIDNKIKSIDAIYDRNTLVYTFRGKDSTLKVLNKFNQELYFLCTDIYGRKYIRYLNGKKKKIKDSTLLIKRIYRGTFFFKSSKSKIAYSITGKKLFSINTKNRIDNYGKSQFIEYYKIDTGYCYNIISKEGEYLIKGLWWGKYLSSVSFNREVKPTYYKDKDSCYNIQNTNGQVFKFCEKGNLYLLNKSFIVFIDKDSLLKVYNSKGKFLGEGFQENRRFVIRDWYDDSYFICSDRGKPIMLNKEGKKIVLPNYNDLSIIFPINDRYFFSYYWLSSGVSILVFDDKGRELIKYDSIGVREDDIVFFRQSIFQENNLKYPSALLYPLINASYHYYRKKEERIERPKLLSITPSGVKEITLDVKNVDYIYLIDNYNGFEYLYPYSNITLFNKVQLYPEYGTNCYDNGFYVDIYGTVYYDE